MLDFLVRRLFSQHRRQTHFTPECVRVVDFYASGRWINRLTKQWQQYVSTIPPYPAHFKGKGIVMCAGGVTYFTCAWVNISLLRMNGCTLPIEVWYSGNELNDDATTALKLLNVRCRNCKDYTTQDVTGYAMKPFAILHSDFEEVLFLDADNSCVKDPSFLFDSAEYRRFGAVFWPDLWTTDRKNPIWKITGAKDFDSAEQESGQILINKGQCWKALNLCWHFNLHHQDYYRMLLGDKDTFRFAWMALGTPYFMMPTPVGFCGFNEPGKGFAGMSMLQHDFNGYILFLHRNLFKWDVTRDDEQLWMEIKRFKAGARNRRFLCQHISRGKFNFPFVDIQGDVELLAFKDLLGNFELRCLDILKELRASDFYTRFLLHMYFVSFRPGYSDSVSQKMFEPLPAVAS